MRISGCVMEEKDGVKSGECVGCVRLGGKRGKDAREILIPLIGPCVDMGEGESMC